MVEKLTAEFAVSQMLRNTLQMLVDGKDEEMLRNGPDGWRDTAMCVLDRIEVSDADLANYLDAIVLDLDIDWFNPTAKQVEEYANVIVRRLKKVGRI